MEECSMSIGKFYRRYIMSSSQNNPFEINKLEGLIRRIFLRNNGKEGWSDETSPGMMKGSDFRWAPNQKEWRGSSTAQYTVGNNHYRIVIEAWEEVKKHD